MKIYAADDEIIALETLKLSILKAMPEAELTLFSDPLDLLDAFKKEAADVVFLDIHMPGIDGMELAVKLKDIKPDVNLIFCTGYDEYAVKAFGMLASGYILKPVNDRDVKTQLQNLRNPLKNKVPKYFAQCFGNFTFFVNGRPVSFSRSKGKELFAYLIDRKGAVVTRKEIAAVLFEDEPYSRNLQKHLSTIVQHIKEDLAGAGASEVFNMTTGGYSISADKIVCDMYEYLNKNPEYPYLGEYMEQYSWGEDFKSWQYSE